MNSRDGSAPSCLDHPLWSAISADPIGNPNAALAFVERLARENGWSVAHAARVLAEYRRFCFLAVTANHTVTPSDAVDQAWHLHLTHSRDYWERFCPSVLGRPLHHDPGGVSRGERHRHFEQYAETLKSYERAFGENAPADLWPNAATCLIEDSKARRIHPRDFFLIPRRLGIVLILLVCAAFLACLMLR
jgi:hypothetical protein